MGEKSFFNFRNLVAIAAFFFVVVFVLCGNIFAAGTFDSSNYPGWCVGSSNLSGGNLSITLNCCDDSPYNSIPYTGQLSLSYTDCICDFTYSCGACVSGYKACTYTKSPATATCANSPQTTQPCTSPAPTVTISVPTNGAIAPSLLSITFGYTGATSYEIYDGSTMIKPSTTLSSASGSTYYTWNTSAASEGSHTIKVKVYGSGGNGDDVRTVIIDRSSASVTLTSPPSSSVPSIVAGSTYTLSADAYDAYSGIYKVEFRDITTNALLNTDITSPYSYDWNTTGVSIGTHTIVARAYDKAGNTYDEDSNPVSIQAATVADTVAPSVSITAPTGGIASGMVTITATATDTSGISEIQFWVGGVNVHTYNVTTSSTTYSYDWDSTTVGDGATYLTVKAKDGATTPNLGISPTVNISVDNIASTGGGGGGGDTTPPNVEITFPKDGANVGDTVNVVASASDAGGIRQVKFYVNGEYQSSDTSFPYGFAWDTSALVDGDYKLSAKAYDETGNDKDSAVIKVTVEKVTAGNANPIPPVVSSTVCEYSCSNWSGCGADGKKLCIAHTYTPAGAACSNSVPVFPPQDCNISVAPVTCSYSCNKWGDCTSANIKTCIEVVASPAGATCSNTLTTLPADDCQYAAPAVTCSYYCDQWGACVSSGEQSCLKYSHTPANSNCTNIAPSSPRACTYIAPAPAIVPAPAAEEAKEVAPKVDTGQTEDEAGEDNVFENSKPKKKIPCNYAYSAFGACVKGLRSRIALSRSPQDCQDDVVPPELEQACKESLSESGARPKDAPAPAPEAVTAAGVVESQENGQLQNYNGRTSAAWQKYYFDSEFCNDAVVCGGDADLDNDGLSNNDEYRFGTDPNDTDTDKDGFVDAAEIQSGRDPLVAASDTESDAIILEDPKLAVAGDEGIYQVVNVETVGGEKGKKISKLSGKALPNTYVTLYIYSDPIVMTVKTDMDGNWSYVLDKPLELGNHEVYVAVTSNTGKIVAKSNSFAFAQTAEAAVALTSPGDTEDRAPSPVKSRMSQGYLLVGLLSLAGVALAVVSIGLIRGKAKSG